MLQNKKYPFYFWLILLAFAIVYALITFVNHYYFRTNTHDLGLYVNALYDYARFRANHCTMLYPYMPNLLGDHFTVVQLLFAPFSYVFGSYTLLIAQWAALLMAGVGIYRYILFKTDNNRIYAALAMLHFYCFFGIYGALGFEYHDNVIAACLMPWFFLYFEQKNIKLTALFCLWILLTKENMAMWMICVGFGLAWLHYKDRQLLKTGLLTGIVAMVYFVVVVKFIMPSLGNGEYRHFHYTILGSNWGEAFTTLLTNPMRPIKYLLFDINDKIHLYKGDLYAALLLCGGVALVIKPQYLFMLLPIILQKVWSNDIYKWGIFNHYNIEFAPIITIAFFTVAYQYIKNTKWLYFVGFLGVVGSILCLNNIVTRYGNFYFSNQKNNIFNAEHYKCDFDVEEMNRAINLIPANAIVSANNPAMSRLANRDVVYFFPDVNDAEYLFLVDDKVTYYPISQEQYYKRVAEVTATGWQLIYNKNITKIYKREK